MAVSLDTVDFLGDAREEKRFGLIGEASSLRAFHHFGRHDHGIVGAKEDFPATIGLEIVHSLCRTVEGEWGNEGCPRRSFNSRSAHARCRRLGLVQMTEDQPRRLR